MDSTVLLFCAWAVPPFCLGSPVVAMVVVCDPSDNSDCDPILALLTNPGLLPGLGFNRIEGSNPCFVESQSLKTTPPTLLTSAPTQLIPPQLSPPSPSPSRPFSRSSTDGFFALSSPGPLSAPHTMIS